MRQYKPLLWLLLFLFSGFNLKISKAHFTKWVIARDCSLKVGGSTNINKFSCVIAQYDRPDTLTVYKQKAAGTVKMAGGVMLDVNNFDCNNPVMTVNLRKSLKAKTFPKLTIRFISLARYPDYQDGADAMEGAVTIELAGVTKHFDIDYRFISRGPNSFTLAGTRQVKFSDFNIDPPKKMGGIVQAKNELSVTFNLKVKILD